MKTKKPVQPKYTIKNFRKDFPNDDSCLDFIFNKRFADETCQECGKNNCFYKVTNRKCYACSWCGNQIHPLAGTIFHKSSTKLTDWFYALYLFSASKNGVSSKELERQLGVTYKCAWRMAKQIRKLMSKNQDFFDGTVELDETHVGGKGKNNKRSRGTENKTPVFGIVQRKGVVKAQVTVDTKRKTVMPIIRKHIKIGTDIMTDEYLPYKSLNKEGYNHQTVSHGSKEYVRGAIHTNTLEGFWSQLKRSINGTYHAVSPACLQSYVDEFSYRYNHRTSPASMFQLLLQEV